VLIFIALFLAIGLNPAVGACRPGAFRAAVRWRSSR
jgi:hypothetical protein